MKFIFKAHHKPNLVFSDQFFEIPEELANICQLKMFRPST